MGLIFVKKKKRKEKKARGENCRFDLNALTLPRDQVSVHSVSANWKPEGTTVKLICFQARGA